VIIVVEQVGAVKIYVAAVEALRKKERQDETEFTTKIASLFRSVKFSFPVTPLMPYYAETDCSHP
jgi:hypothetical protein